MLRISWKDKLTNASVLEKVKEDRCRLNTVWQRNHRWLGQDVLRNEVLLQEIIAGIIAKCSGEERDYIC